MVSRGTQSTVGLATGVLVYAVVALGGGYLAAVVVPFVKYPANPPSVGNPDTLSARTVIYFAMVGLAVALAIASTLLGRWLVPRLGAANATIVAGAAFVGAWPSPSSCCPRSMRYRKVSRQRCFGALVHRHLTRRAAY